MALPFRVKGLYAGLAECVGLLRDEGDHLAFEFQVKDGLFGIAGPVRLVRIPVVDINEMNYTDGWVGIRKLTGGKIAIQCERLQQIAEIPGSQQGKVELSIAAADVDAAKAFVAGLHRS